MVFSILIRLLLHLKERSTEMYDIFIWLAGSMFYSIRVLFQRLNDFLWIVICFSLYTLPSCKDSIKFSLQRTEIYPSGTVFVIEKPLRKKKFCCQNVLVLHRFACWVEVLCVLPQSSCLSNPLLSSMPYMASSPKKFGFNLRRITKKSFERRDYEPVDFNRQCS